MHRFQGRSSVETARFSYEWHITDTKKPAQKLVFLLTLKTITLQQQLLG